MRAHFFQHVPFEGLGSIASWLEAHSAVVTATRFFADAVLPEADGVDLLIVMGGPMSVNDEGRHPWLIAEKRFIAQAIRRGKAVLGVCLGAQLIAAALGARVYPNTEKEIGWFPVYSPPFSDKVGADAVPVFRFPEESLVFHWHGETFDLPTGAVHLARNGACLNQAFQYGRRVVGLQFHLEMTPRTVCELADDGRDEFVPARHVQSEAEILSVPVERYAENNRLMADLLSFLTTPEG
jgi:GMP synthase-like glutamine amidotransferase